VPPADDARARPRGADEHRVSLQLVQRHDAVGEAQAIRGDDPGQLVLEERLAPHALGCARLTGDPEVEPVVGDQPRDGFARHRADGHGDGRMPCGEPAQRARDDDEARHAAGGDRERPLVSALQRLQVALHDVERVQHPGGVRGNDAPGLGQPASPPVAVQQQPSGGGFERAQVHRGRWLSDRARGGSGGDRSASVDLNEQLQAQRVDALEVHLAWAGHGSPWRVGGESPSQAPRALWRAASLPTRAASRLTTRE
jgi:hypothetical protein